MATQQLEDLTINKESSKQEEYTQQRKKEVSSVDTVLKKNKIIDWLNETDDNTSGNCIIY